MRRRLQSFLLCILLAAPARAETVTAFVAASLGDALRDAAAAWETETGHAVVIAAAGSSALARQIAAGAPADLFVSANLAWMDHLAAEGLIVPDTRRSLLANRLVLVAHGPGDGSADPIRPGFDLAASLGTDGRLAMGLVDAVPAGIYGRQALASLGLWDDVADRLVQADNVRAALAFVALGEAPLGVVYATDAGAEPGVHVVGRFPAGSHDAILYPVAVTAEARAPEAARALLDWLGGADAQAVFAEHGFDAPPD